MTPRKTLDEYVKYVKKEISSKTNQQLAPQYKITGFYKETEFQETEVGRIPKEWRVRRLLEIVEVWDKYRIPVKETNRKPGPYPYCGANGIIDYVDGYTHDGEFVLLAEDGGFFGPFEKSAYIMRGKFWANNHVHVLKPKKEFVNTEYLMYFLNYADLRPYVTGTTRPKLNQASMEKIPVTLPPIDEQKGIAEILLTVDRAIEGVDVVVVRLERLKKGLMRGLLTGRVRVREENGRLIFYRETEFQETEIGKIPRDWKFIELAHLAQIIMGQSPPSSTYNREGIGIPFLQGKMEFGRIYPFPVMYTIQPLKIAEPNDVLISVRAPVGDVNIAPCRLCIGRGLAAIRFNPEVADYMFYFYYFQLIKERLEVLGKGSTFKAITKKDLERLKVVQPSVNEQRKIAEILSTVDKAIELYREKRVWLERLKRGLMDLLLSGRVRVRVESVS